MSIFSERLSYLLKREKLTQAHFASDLGITPQKASLLIKGREPSYDLLINIAHYFHVTIDFLLGASDKENISISSMGDVAKVFLSLIQEGDVSFLSVPVCDGAYQVNFTINNYEATTFFADYGRMSDLLVKGQIPETVFHSWLKAELDKLKNIPLPATITWDDLQALVNHSQAEQSNL